jgi:hypothetical protein
MAPRSSNFSIRLSVRDAEIAARALRKFGGDGDKALGKIEKAARRNSEGFKKLDRSRRELQAGMQGLTRSIGPLGGALSALGPAGIAAAVGLGAVTLGMKNAVDAGVEHEKSMKRIEALLKSTGNASGLTAEQIDKLAFSIAKSTLASTKGAREAAAALLTFTNVSGTAFERTLRVAQDLASVFGTSLKGEAVKLGKALQDPERNLSQLNRSGISFTQTQIDLIKGFRETGDNARATSLILETIEKQVGGSAKAEAEGLAGAWDTFGENLGKFFENASKASGIMGPLTSGVNALADGLDRINKGFTLESQLDAAIAERDKIARLQDPGSIEPRERAEPFRPAAPPLYAAAARHHSGARHERARPRAGRRRGAQPDQPAERLLLPPPLPAGRRALLTRDAGATRRRRRPSRVSRRRRGPRGRDGARRWSASVTHGIPAAWVTSWRRS